MEGETLMRIPGMLAALILAAPGLHAQAERTAAENCFLCKGDAKTMERACIVSHGPFPFGINSTKEAEALLPTAEIYWIESAHFRLGFAAGSAKVDSKSAKKVRAELERLKDYLPKVKPKSKVLTPWLRAHLYAQRFEDAYEEFLEVMQVEESVFPEAGKIWMLGTPYWGEGPYLGQRDKYEVLVLPNADQQVDYLSAQFGLQIKHTQKWNILKRGTLNVVTNLLEDNLQADAKLHGHLVFNLIHNFVDGFKFYTYDTPYWVQEGLSHYFERKLSTRYNSFSRSEGGVPLGKGAKKWVNKVKSMINSGKVPRLAELMALRAYADFTLEHHYTCWSMVKFLVETRPTAFAELNKEIHGRKAADGGPDGTGISDAFRAAFKEHVGMSYSAFDRAWREWALEQEE